MTDYKGHSIKEIDKATPHFCKKLKIGYRMRHICSIFINQLYLLKADIYR